MQPQTSNAKVAQLVEHNLAKVRVAGSSPVFRSRPPGWWNGRHEGLKILWSANDLAGSIPALATSVQMMDASVPIRVHNLAYKAVKNMRVKNVTVLMDTHKANAGAKRNNIM